MTDLKPEHRAALIEDCQTRIRNGKALGATAMVSVSAETLLSLLRPHPTAPDDTGEGRDHIGDATDMVRRAEGEEFARARALIAAALDAEADMVPCAEDASVYRSAAMLVRANFSYDDAERLAASLRGEQGEAVAWSEYEDDLSDAISDSIDMDWTSRDGAKAVVRWLNENCPAPPSLPGREELKQIIEEHVWAELAGPREDRADVCGIANAVDAILARLNHKPEGEG